MIAFHYPPYQGSSGALRTLNFTKYLPQFHWQPLVLTAGIRVYEAGTVRGSKGLSVPEGVVVARAASLDSARDLSLRGRYPSWLALPDRWVTWCVPAVIRSLALIRKYRPAVIWSTYPIATAHLIGLAVHRLTGLPWVADFRDSMTEDDYPRDARQRRVYRWIESKAVRAASRVIFTTPGAAKMYADRYPQVDPAKWAVIPNGYDEETFLRIERGVEQRGTRSSGSGSANAPFILLHSGVLYPVERDPQPLLQAIANLKVSNAAEIQRLRIVLRATAHDEVIRPMLKRFDVEDIVRLEPPLPYEAALEEMLNVDALLLLQAANCNHQIPAKLYEYLRSGRPVLALTDHAGDTAATLKAAGIDTIADLADAADIEPKLLAFVRALAAGSAVTADREFAVRFSRRSQTGDLARLMTELVAPNRSA